VLLVCARARFTACSGPSVSGTLQFYAKLRVLLLLLSLNCRFLPNIHYHYLNLLNKEQSASELYRLSDHRLSVKLMPTFVDRECRVVSATDTHGRILGFLDRSRYFFFQVAPQLYSGGWVDPVPDPLLLRKVSSGTLTTRPQRRSVKCILHPKIRIAHIDERTLTTLSVHWWRV
jgi:hypothetical protein